MTLHELRKLSLHFRKQYFDFNFYNAELFQTLNFAVMYITLQASFSVDAKLT